MVEKLSIDHQVVPTNTRAIRSCVTFETRREAKGREKKKAWLQPHPFPPTTPERILRAMSSGRRESQLGSCPDQITSASQVGTKVWKEQPQASPSHLMSPEPSLSLGSAPARANARLPTFPLFQEINDVSLPESHRCFGANDSFRANDSAAAGLCRSRDRVASPSFSRPHPRRLQTKPSPFQRRCKLGPWRCGSVPKTAGRRNTSGSWEMPRQRQHSALVQSPLPPPRPMGDQ